MEPTTKFSNSTDDIQTCCVFCDYIFLDTDERRRFAQVSHEYLIEQLQFSIALMSKMEIIKPNLDSNHPVKELVWVANSQAAINHNFEHNNAGELTVNSALLQLNGQHRFRKRDGSYFTRTNLINITLVNVTTVGNAAVQTRLTELEEKALLAEYM